MRTLITGLLLLMLAFSMTACAKKNYMVTTKSGITYQTQGPLEYDVKTETYKFINPEGKEVILNQENIEVIQETN